MHYSRGIGFFCFHLFIWLLDSHVSTLQLWQQTPWAHSAPAFRVQLLALQQGLVHSCTESESWVLAKCYKYTLMYQHTHTDLFLSTITFLSVLQVTIAAALPSNHGFCVWQIKETLPSSRRQVALQFLLVAIIEHTWKWVPEQQWRGCVNTMWKQYLMFFSCVLAS